mgnify:CR=1 FL=1
MMPSTGGRAEDGAAIESLPSAVVELVDAAASTIPAAPRTSASAARTARNLDLVGLAIHADKRDVDKVVKGLKLHG